MGWDDFYRRRDAIDAVLATAGRRRDGALPYEELPEAREVFQSKDELLSALQYKWRQTLNGQIDSAIAEADDDPSLDRFDIVRDAWVAASKRAPVLRAILDANTDHPAISQQLAAERGKLAHLAGLTSAGDTTEDAAHLGATFIELVHAGQSNRTRRGPAFLRKLVDTVSA